MCDHRPSEVHTYSLSCIHGKIVLQKKTPKYDIGYNDIGVRSLMHFDCVDVSFSSTVMSQI